MSRGWHVKFIVEWQRIYTALQKQGMSDSSANVGKLCDYLEAIVRDAINNALTDFAQNGYPLEKQKQENKP